LLEFKYYKIERIEAFFGEFLGYTLHSDKAKIFEKKLKEILDGRDFPLGNSASTFSHINFFNREKYLREKQISYDNWYQPTNLSSDFTLALYKMWKVESEFLNFVICYYFANYLFESPSFDHEFIKDNEIFNKHISLDLTPFFIYKEQAESVADFLEDQIFQEEESLFGDWGKSLIKGLRKSSDLPYEINKKTKKKIMIFLLLFYS
jgi:hypothetical protein